MLVAAALYFHDWRALGIAVALVAGVTDYLDGAVARATGQVTRLGELLDQFGDHCYETLAFLMAIAQGFFPPALLFVYLFREFWVGAIRRYMAGARVDIPSSVWGKLKTNFLMWGFLPAFLSLSGLVPAAAAPLRLAGQVIVGLGLVFSYLSALGYTRAFVIGYGQERG